MGKEESPQVDRRTTRSSSSTTPNSKNAGEVSKIVSNAQSLTENDLVLNDEPTDLEELIDSFPHRRVQILELIKFLGPSNSPMIPLFVYGGASTGKTSAVLEIFKHLNRPFIYSSCITCYNPRILFESILNQLLFHRKNRCNGYSSAKRCERPSDFVNLLHDALSTLIDRLNGNLGKSNSKKSASQVNGKMIYLIFDNLEHVREWDKSSNILPFLFNLYDILKMPEVGLIFISKTSVDTYYSDTGNVEPFPVYFPDYTEDDLRQIFMKNQSNPKLYSSFLDVVLRPFCRITRRIDDITAAISPLYKKYCEPLDDPRVTPNEDTKRKLFRHINPYILQSLKETFHVPSQPTVRASPSKHMTKRKGITKKPGFWESLDEMDFHMSTCAKYLLISAFLASRNPATLDASLFDSTGGSGNQKRKRKSSEKSMEKKESKEQELLVKGPGTFPLERLLAIFQCITSVAEYSPDDEMQQIDGRGADGWASHTPPLPHNKTNPYSFKYPAKLFNMEFWGAEVKAGESLKVQPEFGKLIHISQASLGEVKDMKGAKRIPIRMKIDTNKYVIGTLSAEERPQVMFDLVFEREFELSHDWKNGSVYFIGYIADDQAQDEQDFSDESDDEEYPIEAFENGGKAQLKVEDLKPAKEEATAAKTGIKKEEAPESNDDEDDSDESGSDDLSGGMDSEDLIGDSDDSSDEETPEPKKRPSFVLETPVSNKKAKLASPSKTGNKSVHTATPYPSKKAGKGKKNK